MKSAARFALIVCGATLLGIPLAAQDLRFGLQATLASPLGDLGDKAMLDGSLGYGIGAHAMIGFAGGHAIVPRLDYTYFEKSSPTRKAQMFQVGADYNYFISGKVNQGLYVGVGVGFGMTKFEVNTPTWSSEDTPNTAYGAASAGYMFTPNLGAEIRYTYAKYEPEFYNEKPSISSPTVMASFIYRF